MTTFHPKVLQSLAAALTGLVLAFGAQAGEVLDAGDIQAALSASPGDEAAARWLDLARAGRFARLRVTVDQWRQTQGNALKEEEALYRFVVGLRQLAPENIPAKLVTSLTDYASRVYYWHPESRRSHKLPLFNIAAAARGTLRLKSRMAARHQALEILHAAPAQFWSSVRAKAASSAARAGYLDALRAAPLDLLRPARASLLKRGPVMDGAAGAIMALRLRDPELASRVLANADALTARRLVTAIEAHFPAARAFALLRRAARRPEIASVAVAAIGTLAGHAAGVQPWLLERLSDPALGASAAMALARLEDPGVIAQVAADLDDTLTTAGLKNRLLLLHLSDSPPARALLRQSAQRHDIPAHLRAEVERWLAD